MAKAYEAMVILPNVLKDDEIAKALGELGEEIARLGGEVTRSDVLGSKGFARPMKKQHAGVYARVDFSMPPEAIARLRQRVKLRPSIFRMQIIAAKAPAKAAATPAPEPEESKEGAADARS